MNANATLGMDPCPRAPIDNPVSPLFAWAARYRQVLEDRGRSPAHVAQVYRHITTLLLWMRAREPADLTEDAIEGALARLRRAGRSARTVNSFLRDFKSYCKWCCRPSVGRHLPFNPAEEIRMDPEARDRRHRRVPFTDEQLQRLLATTRASRRQWHGITGAERAEVYHALADTGVRVGTLRLLEVGQFDLGAGGGIPCLRPRAEQLKDGDNLVIPLNPPTVARLRRYFARRTPRALAFRLPPRWQVIRMLRADLRDAGIPPLERTVTADGRVRRERVLDAHSFRMTFAVRALRGGVPLTTVQRWLGHSTPELTANIYNHVSLSDAARAMAKVPPVPGV